MRGRSALGCALAVAATFGWTAGAEARTFEVTRLGDPAPDTCTRADCSLREAILRANVRAGADEIVLPKAKVYRLARANPGDVPEDVGEYGDLDISGDPLAIVHRGRGRATIRSDVEDRVLHAQAEASIGLRKIVVRSGSAVDGGGILAFASVRLVRSAVVDNLASNDGGGIDVQGLAAVTLIRSQLSRNTSGDDGGGVNGGDGNLVFRRSRVNGNVAEDQGGGIRTTSDSNTTLLVRSTVSANQADAAGGIEVEGDSFRMRRSTVAGNRARADDGGGVRADGVGDPLPLRIDTSTISANRAATNGGGIALSESTLAIANSTVANNRALDFGGGFSALTATDLSLNAVTVVRNHSGADDEGAVAPGGGIFRNTPTGSVRVRNSIIALNRQGADGEPNDCAGEVGEPFDSLGHNLLSTLNPEGLCNGFDGPGDLVRSNPKLGNLRRNGGPTKTVALKRGSAAIGGAHKPSAPNRDQRGRKRDRDPDIGAFERGA